MITLTDKKTKNHKKSRTFQGSRVSESIGETEAVSYTHLSYIKNDRILFSAPIPGESGSRRVVVGSQYYEELKTLSNLSLIHI